MIPKETVTIVGSHVGIIIGPKDATMMAIQEHTGCKLDGINSNLSKVAKQPRSPLSSWLPKEQTKGLVLAKKAILELANCGYEALLQGEQFGEPSVLVHPKYMLELWDLAARLLRSSRPNWL